MFTISSLVAINWQAENLINHIFLLKFSILTSNQLRVQIETFKF